MFALSNRTTLKTRIPFERIKDAILGKKYDLSLVLMGDTLATGLNKTHKGRKGPTDVLSFPLDRHEGEIFINVRRAERDAKSFGHTPRQHIAFLYIHSCLHLAGFEHGEDMEKREDALLQKFI
tara:strand:- start:7681 stop:8049 length:369 start_codon:yes stop_codon:yes gene_type:complete